ncbi:rod shape-determining protein RodA [Clostridia bacterium]|nr:rod shape-determining protein RodA [Clostridia bacterium]GHU76677.1 rod shape-determining protein RodA [Clostridia bacterium]
MKLYAAKPTRKPRFLDFTNFDFVLLFCVVFMAICGIIVLGSAVRIDLGSPDSLSIYNKQKFWVLSGLVLLFAAAFVDYHFIGKFYIIIYILNILCLVSLFLGFSNGSRGVERWIQIANGVTIQPSEFAKIFMIISLSVFLDKQGEDINKPKRFILLLVLIMLPVGLIFAQPSLSAAMVVFAASAAVAFASKVSYRNILILAACIAPLLVLLYVDFQTDDRVILSKVLEPYQITRIDLMLDPSLDPDLARQTTTSKYAIGSGMLYGKGINNSTVGTSKSETDFIYTILGEEFGFVGCVFVFALMFFISAKSLLTAARASDNCGRLIATGVAAMFFFQSFFHVGVTIGMLPNTGVAFPFFSYGGSSMWTCMLGAGLVINVGRSKKKSIFE